MSEIVEDDENLIVLVVRDGENSKGGQPVPDSYYTIEIDSDYADKPRKEIFKSPIQIEEENAEKEYDAESLEGNNINTLEGEPEDGYEVEYLEDIPDLYEVDDYKEDIDDSNYNIKSSKTTPQTKQSKTLQRKSPQTLQKKQSQKYVSYVQYLRRECPGMAQNEQFLIDHLAGVMGSLKQPEPPQNYCKKVMTKGKLKYKCSFCEEDRDTEPLAARHHLFKHGEFYLTCYACGNKYRNTTTLYKHEKRCPAPDAPTVLRARDAYLGRKGRGRTTATNNQSSTANAPVENKEKTRFFCSKCPASFVHLEKLERHEKSHGEVHPGGERPFICHHCNMAYTSLRILKRHVKLHGDYQYTCDHCGRQFKLKSALASHLDTHMAVRKHVCQYCDRRFKEKIGLRHHTNTVHLKLPAAHGCTLCPKRFPRRSLIKQHMINKHKLNVITRRTYAKVSPAMTVGDVDGNQDPEPDDSQEEPEYIVPEITDITQKQKAQLQKN